MKKISFDLTVNSTALYAPNPESWYAKTYIDEEQAQLFRTIPGVKSSEKVATAIFADILKPETCNFTSTDATLSAVTVSVVGISAMVQVCKKDLESSFISKEMAAGSSNWEVASFTSYFFDTMSQEIKDEIADLRWNGSTTNTAYTGTHKALVNGFTTILNADASVIDVAASAVTTANVIQVLATALQTLPAKLQTDTTKLKFYVAPNVATAYGIATAQYNTTSNVTKKLAMTFADIDIIPQAYLPANQIVLTVPDNLVYAFDGISDISDIKIINLSDTTGDELLRARVNLKVGFAILNGGEIVYVH